MLYRFGSSRRVLSFAVALLTAIASRGAEPSMREEPAIAVTLAGEEHQLLFEKKDLTIELQTSIGADIEGVFLDVDEVAIRESEDAAQGIFVKKYHLSTYWLEVAAYKPWLPEALRDYFGVGLQHGKRRYLIVHESVIRQYQDALEIKRAYPEAFGRIDTFLSLFNDGKRRQQAASSIDGARRFFCFRGIQPWSDYKVYAENLGLVRDGFMKIRYPSLLDYHVSEGMGNIPGFSAVIESRESSDKETRLQKWPFVYTQGEWRLLIFPTP